MTSLRRLAQFAVSRATKSGQLVRPRICSGCGNAAKIYAHHEDYSKPLEVVWLCQCCHRNRHLEMGAGKNSDYKVINFRVEPELGKQLDDARGLIPMQRYVVKVLQDEMAKLRAVAEEVPRG